MGLLQSPALPLGYPACAKRPGNKRGGRGPGKLHLEVPDETNHGSAPMVSRCTPVRRVPVGASRGHGAARSRSARISARLPRGTPSGRSRSCWRPGPSWSRPPGTSSNRSNAPVGFSVPVDDLSGPGCCDVLAVRGCGRPSPRGGFPRDSPLDAAIPKQTDTSFWRAVPEGSRLRGPRGWPFSAARHA